MNKPLLSVIIPAYNESKRVAATLAKAHSYLSGQAYDHEIIVVDDGSTDDTASLVKQTSKSVSNLSLVQLPSNQGKGAAVKAGMLAAQGEMRLFMDADSSTSIDQVEKLLQAMREGVDIAVGSRRVAGSIITIKQNVLREFLGWVFRLMVKTIVPVGVRDSQNGFKLFSAKAATVTFPKLQTKGLSFDVEVLLRAKKIGLKVTEVPVTWQNDYESKVTFSKMFKMLLELWRIRHLRK